VKTVRSAAKPTLKEGTTAPQPSPKPKVVLKGKAAPQIDLERRPRSKQDRVLMMLRRKEGTTVAAVMKATGWQPHSVRGFFAGVVRKKLGLDLVSEETNGKRVYRIADGRRGNDARKGDRKQAR
jgi:hypothetical protein